MPFFTAIAAWVVTAIGATGVWATVATFAVRAFLTIGLSKLLNRNSDSGGAQATGGGRVPVNPSTENKIPVVYGTAFMAGTVIDAKISDDNKWMWYVFAMSEVTGSSTSTISYGDIYWNGNLVEFDPTEHTKVIKLTTNSDPVQENLKVNGNGWIYLYTNGSLSGQNTTESAIHVLQNTTIPVDMRWTSTCTMDRTAFIIVKVQFNQDAGITSCPTITAKMTNTLNKPGAVLLDYMTNDRYGCGIPIASIDTGSLDALDTYSDELISYYNYPYTGATSSQPRYRINGPLMTGNECMTNITQLTDSCDCWLKFNEITSQWSIVINQSYLDYTTTEALFHVTDDNLIGGIEITPTDLNSTYNAVELQYPNTNIKDGTDYQYINLKETDPAIMSPNEPFNQQTINLVVVNNAVQAIYLGARRLYQGREDLTLTFLLDYSGIQIEAGDVIRITSSVYKWDASGGFPYGKLFRVIQVQESKVGDGSLGTNIVASEYNETVYADDVVQDYIPADNSGLSDPTILGTPNPPVISDPITTTAIPSFKVTTTVPSVGTFISLEYWYAIAPTGTPPTNTTDFKLWETQYFNSGPVYPAGDETTIISGLPASDAGYGYYFRVRACGQTTKSSFSNNSDCFVWGPNPTATIIGQNFQTSFQPSPITVGQYGNGEPDLANVTIRLYGLVGPGQVDFNSTQSNAALGNSEWRVDNANIVFNGITVGDPTDGGTYALWPAPTALTANVASMTVPIVFKDSLGNLYTSPPSIININKTIAGQDGPRGIVTLAYVPVSYNPTTANDTVLTASFDTTTGYSYPINQDGAVFYASNNLASSRQYNSATSPKWQYVTLQVPGTVITGNSIANTQIVSHTITGDKISGNTITGNLITAGTITGNLIANRAIVGNLIATSTITGNLVANNTITGNLVANNTITGNLVANNTITGNLIANNTITGNLIADNTITGNLIANNTITGNLVANNTITGNLITDYSITGLAIANNTITGTAIANNTITGDLIANNTITGNLIANNTLTGNLIADNTITGNLIADNTITGNLITDYSITGLAIANNTITGTAIANNTITGNLIADYSITGLAIANNTITGTAIANNTITGNLIANNAITGNLINTGAITTDKLSANSITTEKLMIGAATQSKSTISTPTTLPQPFYNWSTLPKTWPDNTRCITPSGGVTIIPTTDPRSSANTEYQEGSRIEVGFSARLYTEANEASNLLEIWKSGASSVYDRGFNTIRHSYNWTANSSFTTQTIHAYGYGAQDYISSDGGATWSIYNSGSTTKTITGAADVYSSISLPTRTDVWGPLQNSDVYPGGPQYAYAGARQGPAAIVFDQIISIAGIYQNGFSCNAYEVAPNTGGNVATGHSLLPKSAFTPCNNGILIMGHGSPAISTYHLEVTNTLQNLYSVYSNDMTVASPYNYTSVCVGGTGTILTSTRVAGSFTIVTWSSKAVLGLNGLPLQTDLYGVAGDDTVESSASKWVAVGEYSVVMYSADNGEHWTQYATPTATNLNAVRYCNGTWVAVGDGGTILSSTNGTTWTQVTSGTTLNLFTIDYSPKWNTINIGGQGIILHSSASSLSFSTVVSLSPTETMDLTRLTWFGSNESVANNTVGPVSQQILNSQVFSGTIVDVDYSAGQETTYYLVLGNMAGATVQAGQIYLLVTEVKR